MRKNLIFLAMASAALALFSCSKDEVVSESPTLKNAIEFSTYLGRSAKTKGSETTVTTIQAENAGFGVLAYYTCQSDFVTGDNSSDTPNFMYNEQVTYNFTSKDWEYNPVKYWPTTSGDKISFFAYAPYSTQETQHANGILLSVNNAKGTPTVAFTIAQDASSMVDFVADAVYDKTWIKDATGEKPEDDNGVNESEVKFNLIHELTRVSFIAKVDEKITLTETESSTRVAITSIKLNGGTGTQFYNSAKYTFPTADDAQGTWSYNNGDAALATTAYDIASVLDLKKFSESGLSPLDDDKTFESENYSAIWLNPASTTTSFPIFKSNEYLFLIPPAGVDGVETATGNGATDPMSITVSYDIITKDANLEKGYSKTSATKTVSLGGDTSTKLLIQGKSYVYTLIFGIDEIKVSATVSGWDTAIEDETHVDYNVN